MDYTIKQTLSQNSISTTYLAYEDQESSSNSNFDSQNSESSDSNEVESSKEEIILKIFNIPPKMKKSFYKTYNDSLILSIDGSNTIKYDAQEQILDFGQLRLLTNKMYHGISVLDKVKSNISKTISPSEALFLFVQIIHGYIEIVFERRKPIMPLSLEFIIQNEEGQVFIDYLSHIIWDKISIQNIDLQKLKKITQLQQLAYVLYQLIYFGEEQQLLDAIINKEDLKSLKYDEKYDEFSINRIIQELASSYDSYQSPQKLIQFLKKIMSYLQQNPDPNLNFPTYPDGLSLFYCLLGDSKKIENNFKENFNQAQNISNWQYLKICMFYNHSQAFQELIHLFQFNINARNSYGHTLLMLAATYGNLSIIKYLINEKNADYKIRSNTSHLPLTLASREGYLEIVKYFIETLNEDPNQKTNNGTSGFLWASMRGYLDIVKYYVEVIKIDPNQITNKGNNCLILSSQYGHFDTVKYLIEEVKVDPNVCRRVF